MTLTADLHDQPAEPGACPEERPGFFMEGRRLWAFVQLTVWVGIGCGSLLAVGPASAQDPSSPSSYEMALEGPWRWLEPDLGVLDVPSQLVHGPWLEPSISRDPDRRALALARFGGLAPEVTDDSEPVDHPDHAGRARILDRAARESARLLEAAGESRAAAAAYASVAESESVIPVDVWHGLAANRARSGDLLGAERAFLLGLDASGRPEDQVRFRFDLAGFYAGQGRLLEALAVIDALVPHAPNAAELQWARSGLESSIELAAFVRPRGHPLAVTAGWPIPGPDRAWEDFDPWVVRTVMSLPASMRNGLLPWAERWRGSELGLTQATILLVALAAVLTALFVLLRQRGDVVVVIDYPEELRGLFRVRLRGAHRSLPAPSSEEKIREDGASTHKEHLLVSRETQFQRLFTGRYYVIVDGLLVDPTSDEVLDRIHEHRMLRVRHRKTVRAEIDVRPTACPVDLEVKWGDHPAREAQITVPGPVDKPRATASGKLRVLLPQGDHRLLIGCGDRAFERPLKVSSYRPTHVAVDVLQEEVVFKGCPPAVVPFLTGDLRGTARALERDDQAELGFRLLAQMYQRDGEIGRAADLYESAGELCAAARLRLEQGDPGRAATLFERAEKWIDAAEAHRRDGAILHAGECFERALDYERAIDCYQEAGAIDRWLTALERCGRVFEAAKRALDHEQRPRAIRLLQRVEPTSDHFREACNLLADAFETEGHYDLAAGKLDEFIATFRPDFATAESYSRLAELWEQAGHFERALDVLEELRRREPTFPGVAGRIEVLRKRRSATGHFYNSGSRVQDAGATAFVGDVRYQLLAEIGRGGMGIVYRARDTRLDRVVALKRLPEGLRRHHPRALQFFLREAQSAARLNHPNIVTVYDADQQDGQFFITMELLEGQPLQTVLHERGQLSPANVLGIARQACRGLDYAHEQGVVHRDVKTANLFVTTDRVVKIMDFGLAKVLEEVRGATTLVSGTPYYMSPEQVIGTDVDHRTDLYSLGVTLYELATGRVPFDNGEIAYHHRHSPVPDPRTLRPDLSPALAELILGLLEKAPEDRPQTAAAVLEALTRIEPTNPS